MAHEPEVKRMGRVKETLAPTFQARAWNRLVPLRRNGCTLMVPIRLALKLLSVESGIPL